MPHGSEFEGRLRKVETAAPGGPGGVTDHGALTGLADDDHAQYHTDARGDARYSPLGHTHAQLHDPATVSDTSSINLTLSGQLISADAIFGTTAGTVCQGNDARLSDARAPTAHNQAWSTITGTPMTLAGYGISDAVSSSHVGSGGAAHANVVAAGAAGFMTGADKTKLDGIAAGAQVNVATDLSYTASTRVLASSTGADATLPLFTATEAGLAPLSGGGTSNFLRADGTWAAPPAGGAAATLFNQNSIDQGPGLAADTYLVGSNIGSMATRLQIGTRYRLKFRVSKTAAGTATPIITIRYGTAGSTADTARVTLTFPAQTAAIDDGVFEVFAHFTAVGASGVLKAVASLVHRLDITGLANTGSPTVSAVSGAFDTTPGASIIGVSVNGGASAVWTVQLVQAELTNLA